MKKTVFLLCLSVLAVFGSFAQCVVDTAGLAHSNIAPASLPCIVRGQAFSGTISIKVPDSVDAGHLPLSTALQAVLNGRKVPVDSIQINTITGMPSGITQVSMPANGTWLKPGQYACATFSGNTSAASGNYPLTISGTGCGHFTVSFGGNPMRYDSCFQNYAFTDAYPYHLSVCNPAGISDISADMALSIYPNPNHGSFTVTVSATERITGEMTVVDALGRKVHTANIDVTGVQQIPLTLHNAAPGVYKLMINAGGKQSVKQFIVQ